MRRLRRNWLKAAHSQATVIEVPMKPQLQSEADIERLDVPKNSVQEVQ